MALNNWNTTFSDKGRKYPVVDGLILKLNVNKAVVKELMAEKESLQKTGHDLSKSDQEKLQRAQAIVDRLKNIIEKEITTHHLTYEKIKGEYVYKRYRY